MTVNIRQYADGSVGLFNDQEGVDQLRLGGGKAATQATPLFRGNGVIKLAIAGTADTGGAICAWTNNLGYDIILFDPVLDITTQSSGACTCSFGQTPTSLTTSSSNLISGQSTAATGTFTPATPVSVKCAAGTFITGSRASGASAALVGALYVSFIPA